MRRALWVTIGLLISGLGISMLYAQGYGDALVNAMEKTRRLKCQNNLKQVYAVIEQYREGEGCRPASLDVLVEKKLIEKKLLKCPSSSTPTGVIDYRFAKDGDVLCCCREAWHQGGRNVLKSDGTVIWMSEKDFGKK